MLKAVLSKPVIIAAVMAGMALSTLPYEAAAEDKTTGQARETSSRVVGYGDLDLSKPQNAKTLYRRISWAAKLVCDLHADTKSVHMQSLYQHCLKATINNAVEKVGHINLTQVHEGRAPALASR